MASIKRRSVTITSGGAQIYQGPGVLVGAVFDHNASSSSNVITLYDGSTQYAGGIQIYTRSSDTDAGTTVPIGMYTDGDLVAGTSTANVKSGIPFTKGLFLTKTGDTTHSDVYTFFIKPLIAKTVDVLGGATTGAASIFSGPAMWHGYSISLGPATAALTTADFLFKDSPIAGSGNTVMTKTNYSTAARTIRPVVTTTNSDEGGSAVTTAATGAYASPGILLTTGLNVNVAQASASDGILAQIVALFEA